MATQTEIDAAADRLRRVKNGENPVDVYDANKPAVWFKGKKWTAADAKELAEAGIESDQEDLADAYIALGTRQPDETRVFADDMLWNIDTIDDVFRQDFPDAKLVRVATFIQETQP